LEYNLVAAGIGGQGIVLFSEILANAMLRDGLNPSFYVHSGLAQLGGSVRSHIRTGDRICPKISEGCADVILSLELAEILHAVPYLRQGGKALVSTATRKPFHCAMDPSLYPSPDAIRELFSGTGVEPVLVPADEIAREVGHIQALNIVMLGSLVGASLVVEAETVIHTLRDTFGSRADVNVEAFWKGYEFIRGQDYV
jgi:indolepyruvate ferredoxin oxidoreductase beta subunit